MDIKKPKCCGTCKFWENSAKYQTMFALFDAAGNCQLKNEVMKYASKCKDWSQK